MAPSPDVGDDENERRQGDDEEPVDEGERGDAEHGSCEIDDEDLADEDDEHNDEEAHAEIVFPRSRLPEDVGQVLYEASSTAEIFGVEDIPELHHDEHGEEDAELVGADVLLALRHIGKSYEKFFHCIGGEQGCDSR